MGSSGRICLRHSKKRFYWHASLISIIYGLTRCVSLISIVYIVTRADSLYICRYCTGLRSRLGSTVCSDGGHILERIPYDRGIGRKEWTGRPSKSSQALDGQHRTQQQSLHSLFSRYRAPRNARTRFNPFPGKNRTDIARACVVFPGGTPL